jgi:hypothetical protein
MGLYWLTILYEGKVINKEEWDQLDKEIYENNLVYINEKSWIFTKRRITMANINPILGNHELYQGYVSTNELERWFQSSDKTKDLKKRWLKEVAHSPIYDDMKIYIAQIQWDTFGKECVLEYNLPVQ